MARGQPFTLLCQQLSHAAMPRLCDLHIHTTHSDGLFEPAEVVRRALLAKVRAIAVTDHDSLSAHVHLVAALQRSSAPTPLEIIPGVEITCEYQKRELHLLVYDPALDHAPLLAHLTELQEDRRARFLEMCQRVRQAGIHIDQSMITHWTQQPANSLGRRHLAVYLVRSGQVATVQQAFQRYLHEKHGHVPTKKRWAVGDAIAVARQAGGITSWAHPSQDTTLAQVEELREFGLHALEAEYPWPTNAHRKSIRQLAQQAGLAVSGGSDCHGPDPVKRMIGTCGIDIRELEILRAMRTAS